MPSGWYIPKTGQFWILILPSLSLASRPFPGKLWSLKPRGTTSVIVPLAISRIATALFSCKVMKAVLLSGETAIYSGSKSLATVALSPKILTPLFIKSCFLLLKLVKEAVVTLLLSKLVIFPETSIILIEPSGSIV